MQELRGYLILNSSQIINGLLSAFTSLEEVDRLLLLLNVELDRVLNEAKLKERAS